MSEENQGATPEVIDPAEVIEQPKSMDDTIREILHSQQEWGIEAVGDTPAPGAAPEAPEEAAQRIRDAQGKFAAKPDAAAPVVGGDPAAPVIAPVIAEQATAAPNTWKKEVAEQWATLPPAVQAEVIRREADFHKGIEQYRQAAGFADTMSKALTPYTETFQRLGVTPDRAVSDVLAMDNILRHGNQQQKQEAYAHIGRMFNITPADPQEQQQIDPNIAALQQQVHQLNGYIQNQQSTAQQQSEAQLNSEISAFAAEPSHSHFDAVRGHMSALLQAGQAKDLADAYEQAIYANPTTRAAVLAEQQAAQRADAAAKAQAAKAAASVNVRARPAMPVAKPIGSMDDTIRDNYRRLTGQS